MTIVCAYKTEKSVWVGCDGRVCSGSIIVSNDTDKWFSRHGMNIGLAGSARSLTILRRKNFFSSNTPSGLLDEFRAELANDNWESTDRKESGGPADYPCDMIIVDKMDLWIVGGDGSMIKAKTFAAIGSGAPYAYGAAFNAAALFEPEALVNQCLAAACAYDSDCGGTLVVRHVANTEAPVVL